MCRREGLRSGEMKLVRERLHHDRARPGAERGGCSAALRNVRPRTSTYARREACLRLHLCPAQVPP